MAGRPKRRARLEAEARAAGNPIPERADHRASMTERLIAHLEAGTAPWQQSWSDGVGGGRPYNPFSTDPKTAEKGYSGINRVGLMVRAMDSGFADDRWCTRKQAEDKGLVLRPGEAARGCTIEVWKPYAPKATGDEKPGQKRDDDDKNVREDHVRMSARYYTVYNAEQFEDFPKLDVPAQERTWTPVERAEQLLESSGATIRHNASERTPHYSPAFDHIVMPLRERFATAEGYYDVVTHELVHWTGHKSRLDRHVPGMMYGTPAYAREELVAEVGSMFMSAETGIAHNTEQHAAYVKSWIQLLKDDKHAIARAASDASKAVDFVLERDRERTRELEISPEIPEPEKPQVTPEIGRIAALRAQIEINGHLERALEGREGHEDTRDDFVSVPSR